MNKTLGILAHVDAGKTTFAEQLLYHMNVIKQRGRVDHKNAYLDSNDIEKERGITIFADQAIITYNDSNYFLIDTPGHVDFSAEMERSVQVMDYAVIILSAVEGVESHTETVWNILREHKVPTFFFINKTDRVGSNVDEVIIEIKENLTKDVCDITNSFENGEMKKELIEFIAERNEDLLEKYMDDKYNAALWLNQMIKMIKSGEIFPAGSGSALQDIGVTDFFDKLDMLTYTDYDECLKADFAGRVYKIRHDDNGTRLTFIKALSGFLKVRDEMCYGEKDKILREKITQIRLYNGSKYKTTDIVNTGELFAVTGLTSASIGDGLGDLKDKAKYELVPTLKSKVLFDLCLNPKDVLRYFKILDAEDPALNVTWDENLQEIDINVMGVIQLEVLKELVKERFGLNVSFGTPEILYKETIDNTVIGYGHFEPLSHYAEVHLKLEPGERNSGIKFDSTCHVDKLSSNFQNLIKHHIFERDHHGMLTGSPLTDVKITLINGRDHIKHTEGGDFREATFRALRQGLEKAQNILLEPYYDFKIRVDIEQMGRVLTDIKSADGSFDEPKIQGNKVILTGKAPVATFINYSTQLASFTQGKGMITLKFGGYFRCHNEEEVIKRKGYNKNADPEYTSSSIFCSHGHAFSVSWDEAENYMHLL